MNPQQLVKPFLIAGGLVIAALALGMPVAYLAFALVIVACPLMMYFMMRGMDHGGTTQRERQDEPVPPNHEHH